MTPLHALYYAHELTRRAPPDGVDRLTQSLFDASVDLNPHQIEAALFALRHPLSKGVILADEVGLGKTIEAGIVIAQLWAERRRRVLIICPASLRTQWAVELEEKFSLPSVVLDARTAQANSHHNPFDHGDKIVITSINFAARLAEKVRVVQWDRVVIDEAHKLRNSYRSSNKMGQAIRWALEDRRKMLLTATPLQNSLLELYGLANLIDERIFGAVSAFRQNYTTSKADLQDLRARLTPFCRRTLRSQVQEYVRYTKRRAITAPFRPTDDEQQLYDGVSGFLFRSDTYAIPHQQRQLTTLILRKLLASSSHAIAGTLRTMIERLESLKEGLDDDADLLDGLVDSEDVAAEYLDEAAKPKNDDECDDDQADNPTIDPHRLDVEIAELANLAKMATSIAIDTKSRTLLTSLENGFAEMEKMEAARKALIFTESRRTQTYLKAFLEAHGYTGEIVLFSGTNTDAEAKAAYTAWLEANRETGRITGSRQIDMRAALVDRFRDDATIMIATEAAAEGLNLQFCSLLVNYDMPWNPQRVEQRIGRCHRYGQKHDVVVINFLNERNAADRRVYELLDEKFNLFKDVFGASDDVLGTIESGVDFERRILAIYQDCRTPTEIDSAFTALQTEMEDSIKARMGDTQRLLLEHFDEDVHARLRLRLDDARTRLDQTSRMFWETSKQVLSANAAFDDEACRFLLDKPPTGVRLPKGVYYLATHDRSVRGLNSYRLSHPLGEFVLDQAKMTSLRDATLEIDITNHPTRISVVEQRIGQSGWLRLDKLTVEAVETEEHLIFSGFSDDGDPLDQETAEKMMLATATLDPRQQHDAAASERLQSLAEHRIAVALKEAADRNDRLMAEERQRLDKWAEDMVAASEKELADVKARIKDLTRDARKAETPDEQRDLQSRIRDLERKKRRLRDQIFQVEDEIAEKRDALIDDLEKRLSQTSRTEPLFLARWSIR